MEELSNVEKCIVSQYKLSIAGDFDFSFYFSNKQCHEQLWNKMIEILPKYFGYYKKPTTFKELALNILGFHEEVNNYCYACDSASISDNYVDCEYCPLAGKMNHCCVLGWEDFSKGVYTNNLELALKGAKSLAVAWKGGE